MAEFNGVVMAGHPTRFGVEFVTWEWIQQRTGLWQGHYFGGNYTAAKEDFATRAGLLAKGRIFSEEELTQGQSDDPEMTPQF